MDLVILIDEDTSAQEKMNSSKPIWELRDILTNVSRFFSGMVYAIPYEHFQMHFCISITSQWDQEVIYKRIQVADGGFERFLTTYPMHTTNPNYKPQSSVTADIYPHLEGIEYPSVDDIKMKPKNIPDKYIPRVNRTNKPSFGKTSTENATAPIDPIALAREKELMYDQALEKEQEILSIGDELNRIASIPKSPNDVDITDWYHRQSVLEYKFIQKEHELNETISELNAVGQQEVENQMETLQISKQNPQFAEIAKRLDIKAREFSQNERKVAETKQVVESKMGVLRERQKRHLQVSLTCLILAISIIKAK